MVTQIKIEKCRDGYRARMYIDEHPLNVLSHFYCEKLSGKKIRIHYNSSSKSVLEHVIERKEERKCTTKEARKICKEKITDSTRKLVDKLNSDVAEIEFVPLE